MNTRLAYTTATPSAPARKAPGRNALRAMHRVARAPGPWLTEAELALDTAVWWDICPCTGCRIYRCEIEGNTATPCTGRTA